MENLLEDLEWRGLVHQSTDAEALRVHLSTPGRRVYAGFDPTADSLSIGNLVPLLLLKRFQLAGHRPVALVGGATGLVGDPSGKEEERQLRSREEIEHNIAGQRPLYERLLSFTGPNAAILVNNADWWASVGFLEALRDIGKHFSVNMMIQKESVRERLKAREQGISYTEFSYMLLQAYDFKVLCEQQEVTLQMGGSDQWGNIVAGIDLVRRTLRRDVHGLTSPLLTKADGGKFGKTESGTVWLSRHKTSPFAFYQFWLNAADADIEKYFKVFTLLSREEIEGHLKDHAGDPGARRAHRVLAAHVTDLVFGAEGLAEAEKASHALFSGELEALPLETLEEVLRAAPFSDHSKAELATGLPLVDLLPQTSLVKSKREARDLLTAGAVSVNGQRATLETQLSAGDLLHGKIAALRRGKKHWHVTRWS